MAIPSPEPGLVIRYNYLWRTDFEAGHERAKARPACIVAAIDTQASGSTRVVILPITHSLPNPGTESLEIPQKVKEHLRLDEERSWIILTECNIDVWPSPDLSPLPSDPSAFDYGFLPPKFFEKIRSRFYEIAKDKKLLQTQR